MGGGGFDVDASTARATYRASTGTSAFTHDADAKAGKASLLHESLDFKKKPYRESRDRDGEVSVPIAVLCDVTGSMSRIPSHVIAELNKLMKTILDLKVIENPQVLFGAIGDATSDRVPVQMGEFESDDKLIEECLSNIYLEGWGGGQNMESYELFLYMFAHAIHTDSWDKRGEKGFLYIIGDEKCYPVVKSSLLEEHLGLSVDTSNFTPEELVEFNRVGGIPLSKVAEQVQEKWEVFCIRPYGTSNYDSSDVQSQWESILPEERVIKVQDWKDIVPQIAGTVSVMCGASMAATVVAMASAGFDADSINKTTKSLATLGSAPLASILNGSALATEDSSPKGERL